MLQFQYASVILSNKLGMYDLKIPSIFLIAPMCLIFKFPPSNPNSRLLNICISVLSNLSLKTWLASSLSILLAAPIFSCPVPRCDDNCSDELHCKSFFVVFLTAAESLLIFHLYLSSTSWAHKWCLSKIHKNIWSHHPEVKPWIKRKLFLQAPSDLNLPRWAWDKDKAFYFTVLQQDLWK